MLPAGVRAAFSVCGAWGGILYRGFVESLYPRRCPVCGRIADPPGGLACRGCLKKLSFVQPPVCSRCGKQIMSASETLCGDCTDREKSFEGGMALLNYDDLAQRSMVQLKYHGKREYADLYARLAADRFGRRLRQLRPDCLIPVPIHPDKRKIRGYNQAEVLAAGISRYTGIPLRTDLLLRQRSTSAQKELAPEARLINLQRAFTAAEGVPVPERAVLVDDIYTTGSTMEACTRVLKAAGVKEVWLLSICIGSER